AIGELLRPLLGAVGPVAAQRVVRVEDVEASVRLRRDVRELGGTTHRDLLAATVTPTQDPSIHGIEQVNRPVRLDVGGGRAGEAELARAGEADVLGTGAPRRVSRPSARCARLAEGVPAELDGDRAVKRPADLWGICSARRDRDGRAARVITEHRVVGE